MSTDDTWLSISEAAEVLDVSVSTLRAWSASGRIPCARTRGGHRRFNRMELRRWMADGPNAGSARAVVPTIPALPFEADVLMTLGPEIASRAEMLLVEAAPASSSPLPARTRRERAASWTQAIADGLRDGDLSAARGRAVAYGRAMRDAQATSRMMSASLIAMERAVDDALVAHGGSVDGDTADRIIVTVQGLVCAAMEAWATPDPSPAAD